jgi:hypothetical protein
MSLRPIRGPRSTIPRRNPFRAMAEPRPKAVLELLEALHLDDSHSGVAHALERQDRGDRAPLVSCRIRLDERDGAAAPLGSLHDQFGDFDPAGRHMEPRTPVLREFMKLVPDVQKRLIDSVTPGRSYAPMAAVKLWAEHAGSAAKESLAAVRELERKRSLPMFDPVRPERAER